jgi:DNA (cytosine-5)-methyltransferase 1
MVKYLPTNSFNKKYGGNLRVIEDFCWTITTKQVRHPNSGIVKIDENT